MNKTYALVWNSGQGAWQVAGERARRRGKGSTRATKIVALAWLAGGALTSAYALPVGESVVSGKADILRYDNGQQMSINQHSDKLLTEWTSFNVDKGQRVTFNQPSTSSIALNRVTGQQGSSILGSIDANGRVFLVNPNGVLFGKDAKVNVGGLVATTLDIKNDDFQAGRFRFSGTSTANVANEGTLVAGEGGAIALLGAQVMNRSVVQAQMGTVALSAGSDVTLNFDGSKLLNVQIDGAAVNALVSNNKLLKADGGQVLMSARTANKLLQTVVNNVGRIEALTLRNSAGRITLDGYDAGTVNVAGSLNTYATTPGNAGTIDTRGTNVKVTLGTVVDTHATNGRGGVWRIATSDLTVAPGASRPGTIAADTLKTNLATTDIELVAERGNLSVDGAVPWESSKRLTLTSRQGDVAVNAAMTNEKGADAGVTINAANDVRIAAPIMLTGVNARFKLDYGGAYSLGIGGSVTLPGDRAGFESNGFLYTVIHSFAQLQAIEANLGGLYVLGNDIGNPSSYNPTPFRTIGTDTPFSGVFDGLGHSISKLSITSGSPYAGLFGLNTGRIANLALKASTISAASGPGPVAIGALAGENRGDISNVVVSNNMQVSAGASRSNVLGGLVGVNRGTVAQSSFSGNVVGNSMTYAAGGLVGESVGKEETVTISDSTANATVSGGASNTASLGGFVGVNRGGTILNATSLGTTSANKLSGVNVGGLVGAHFAGRIVNGRASGGTTGGSGGTAGGLAGYNSGTIVDSHASGAVDGKSAQAIGGFVGLNQGTVSNSKALGTVTSASSGATGGFVGINQGRDASIDGAEAHGAVSGGQGNNGGFVGSHLGGTIAHSVARGKTTGGENSKTGGFVGQNSSTLADNDASGSVSAGNNASVGGFAGSNAGSGILNVAAATGNVQGGTSSNVGGLVGDNLGEVFGSSASGTVSGGCQATLGGLVGLNAGLVENSTASGRVNNSTSSSKQVYGGLVGVNRGTFRWSYAVGAAAQQKLAGINLGVIE
ncbi:filamentous hemagglutinin [Burkholderia pyrrocinia]|nr:filamentous hemagglutinin [Burkholderia pyrrocinia]